MNNTVVILHNRLPSIPTPHAQDVLDQVYLIHKALEALGYRCQVLDVGNNVYEDLQHVAALKPAFVFNLVESVFGSTGLLHMVPSILGAWKIPYTGVSEEGLYLTTRKVLAKQIMRSHGIATPDWFPVGSTVFLHNHKKYIVKPLSEEGSAGLDEHHVFNPLSPGVQDWLGSFNPNEFFVEEYIEGREFNLSVTGCPNRYNLYPIPEMIFSGYPPDKPRILGYRSKWEEDSFEYTHTFREFGTLDHTPELCTALQETAIACGELFRLSGYFRVDIRMGSNNIPQVLEINGNPCISPDSGFIAAGKQAGYSINQIVAQITAHLN